MQGAALRAPRPAGAPDLLMITLHRLGQASLAVRLNCDLILTVEANPDTVITLVTGARIVVSESPDEVVDAVRRWRAEIARQTFGVPKVTVSGTDLIDLDPEPYEPGGLHPV